MKPANFPSKRFPFRSVRRALTLSCVGCALALVGVLAACSPDTVAGVTPHSASDADGSVEAAPDAAAPNHTGNPDAAAPDAAAPTGPATDNHVGGAALSEPLQARSSTIETSTFGALNNVNYRTLRIRLSTAPSACYAAGVVDGDRSLNIELGRRQKNDSDDVLPKAGDYPIVSELAKADVAQGASVEITRSGATCQVAGRDLYLAEGTVSLQTVTENPLRATGVFAGTTSDGAALSGSFVVEPCSGSGDTCTW